MATKGGNRGDGGNTRIRFIMLEADGNAADLQQIAQAITSAVRPTTIIQQLAAPQTSLALPGNAVPQANGADVDPKSSVEIVDESIVATPSISKKPGRTRVRRYPTPSIVELDLNSGSVPFVQYYQQKNPDDHSKRYLVIAAWLKEYRELDEINNDHIYTCYRTIKLNTVKDIGQVFRGCKQQGWFNSGSQRGWFAINHVGLNQVNNMGNSG